MRLSLALMAALALVCRPMSEAAARGDAGGATGSLPRYELVVFEADGCIYCEAFRQQVVPLYAASTTGREVPLRFVNVSKSDETKMGITGAITIAPTIVLLRDGREVDRITGYTGPTNFMQMVAWMLGR
jgi:thioredoxin-related protein